MQKVLRWTWERGVCGEEILLQFFFWKKEKVKIKEWLPYKKKEAKCRRPSHRTDSPPAMATMATRWRTAARSCSRRNRSARATQVRSCFVPGRGKWKSLRQKIAQSQCHSRKNRAAAAVEAGQEIYVWEEHTNEVNSRLCLACYFHSAALLAVFQSTLATLIHTRSREIGRQRAPFRREMHSQRYAI